MSTDDPQNPPPSESEPESEPQSDVPAGDDVPPVAGDETAGGALPPAGGDEAPAGLLPPADGNPPPPAPPDQDDSSQANEEGAAPPPEPPAGDANAARAGGAGGTGGAADGSSPPPAPPMHWTRALVPVGLVVLAIALIFASITTFVKYEDADENVHECDRALEANPEPGPSPPECEFGGFDDKAERWIWLGLSVISGVLAAVSLIWAGAVGWRLLHPNVRPGQLGLGAMILSSAALLIGLAALLTVIVYVLPIESASYDKWRAYAAVIVGIAAAILIAVLNATFRHDPASARQGQSRVYDVLKERWGALDARMDILCDPQVNSAIFSDQFLGLEARTVCDEGRVHRCHIAAALGIWDESQCYESTTGQPADHAKGSATSQPADAGAKWINGSGYMELWNRLHCAEEALLVVSSREQAVSAGLFDETRLYGSNIENRDKLLDRVRRAIRVLGGENYLSNDVNLILSEVKKFDDNTTEAAQARLVIRDVRHAVNQFRDKSREALIRARNQLMWTGMLTGVAAFAILLLAILSGATDRTILAASVFFLCGAVVGLFDQLRSSGESVSSEEDFGLGRARLVYTPYISGLAAVGGVLLTAMLYATVNGSVLKYQPPPPAAPMATETSNGQVADSVADVPASPVGGAEVTPTETQTPVATSTNTAVPTATTTPLPEAARVQLDPPPLPLVFDLNQNRFGLVMAAIFGLTPSLLISRLQGEANRYKDDLQSTSGQVRND